MVTVIIVMVINLVVTIITTAETKLRLPFSHIVVKIMMQTAAAAGA